MIELFDYLVNFFTNCRNIVENIKTNTMLFVNHFMNELRECGGFEETQFLEQ